MAWYWIILIVIGYMFVAIVTGVLYGVVFDEETDVCTFIGVFWPVTLPIFICMLPFILVNAILEWIL